MTNLRIYGRRVWNPTISHTPVKGHKSLIWCIFDILLKWSFLLLIALMMFSCRSSENSETISGSSLDIYQTVMLRDLPKDIVELLQTENVLVNSDSNSPEIGYVRSEDQAISLPIPGTGIMLLPTVYPSGIDSLPVAMIAVKTPPVLVNSDIQTTRAGQNHVEIRFNMNGANKWADFTAANTGKQAAFAVDGKIYTLPLINAEIRNGMAVIPGLPNEEVATELSALINAGL